MAAWTRRGLSIVLSKDFAPSASFLCRKGRFHRLTHSLTMSTSNKYVFEPPPVPSIPVLTSEDTQSTFPVHRIYCVAKNYAEHIREMGDQPPDATAKAPASGPVFFTKPSDAVVHTPQSSHTPATTIPYALATQQLDHEIELVVAIRRGGTNISTSQALDHVFGYAVGVDLTRRDLQAVSKRNGHPWDTAKAFDHSAPIGCITEASTMDQEAFLQSARLWLQVNGTQRQHGSLSNMIWTVPEIIAALSAKFHLQPGDLIFTGTPSGVGPVVKGDVVTGGIDELASIEFNVV